MTRPAAIAPITIEILYFDGCPNNEALLPRLREILARDGISTAIDLRRITDDPAAQRADLYYQNLRDVVNDAVLAQVLTRLARDEARHFTFMADMVELYLRHGGEAVIDPIRDVIAQFRMPLADTMRGYWRWALRIADTAHYDHTDAYEYLVRTVHRTVDAKSDRAR